MDQKFVWKFVYSSSKSHFLTIPQASKKDKLKWEARFFWPDDKTIRLHLIHESMLDLNNYEHKQKFDSYYLIPNSSFNIKHRRDQLIYKPVIEQRPLATGFGKKIDLEQCDDYEHKELLQNMLQQAQATGSVIPVKKESYTYKFESEPRIKLELSRLEVHNKLYYSACIEGRSLMLVEMLSKAIVGEHESSDYVHFLSSIIKI